MIQHQEQIINHFETAIALLSSGNKAAFSDELTIGLRCLVGEYLSRGEIEKAIDCNNTVLELVKHCQSQEMLNDHFVAIHLAIMVKALVQISDSSLVEKRDELVGNAQKQLSMIANSSGS